MGVKILKIQGHSWHFSCGSCVIHVSSTTVLPGCRRSCINWDNSCPWAVTLDLMIDNICAGQGLVPPWPLEVVSMMFPSHGHPWRILFMETIDNTPLFTIFFLSLWHGGGDWVASQSGWSFWGMGEEKLSWAKVLEGHALPCLFLIWGAYIPESNLQRWDKDTVYSYIGITSYTHSLWLYICHNLAIITVPFLICVFYFWEWLIVFLAQR